MLVKIILIALNLVWIVALVGCCLSKPKYKELPRGDINDGPGPSEIN